MWTEPGGKINRYSLELDYDLIHNLTHKDQDHVVETPGGAEVVQRESSYDWRYAYAGAQEPTNYQNQLQQQASTGSGTTRADSGGGPVEGGHRSGARGSTKKVSTSAEMLEEVEINEESAVMREEDTNLGILHRELTAFRQLSSVLDIYREQLTREGMLGRILQWSQHVLIVEKIDELCAYDGISAVRPSDLTRIRAGDRELRAFERICDGRHSVALDDVALLDISASMTKMAQRFSVISVYCEAIDTEDMYVGELEDLDDDFVVIRACGTARSGDEYRVVLRHDNITRVDADTAYIRQLNKIREAK